MSWRVVIIGAGIAGVSAAGAMRSAGYDGEIVMIGDEPELPYRRPPVSKEIVRGDKTADEIRIKKAAWYDDQRIELRTGVRVESIDVAGTTVALETGETLTYDQLLIATGGRARNPWPATGAHTLRSLSDVPALHKELMSGSPVIVVGAGLIGSEIAASARELGCPVTLLESAELPLPKLLPAELGQMYLDLHRDRGTELHTDVMVSSIHDFDGSTVVEAADGRSWSAPVVVVAVGMETHVELAEAAGIAIASAADGGGILVDDHGRTSVPGVYAAGDVANQPHPVLDGRHRVEHWQGAQNHGTAIGKILAGGDAAFVEVPWCWSDQYGVNLQVVGWPQAGHELVVDGSLTGHDFIAYLLDDGIVRAAVSIGRPRDIRTARAWIADQARLADVIEKQA
ncbi:NAD(P)/FAD-dependent oxidoreductase [Aeromicrobium sp. P5_D10]